MVDYSHMTLTVEQIEQIATLARLDLTPEEKERYAKQLSAVLAYVELLNEVDTTGVAETCQVTGLEDVVRSDEPVVIDDASRAKLLETFPDKVGNLLKVKAVFDESQE